MLFLLAAAAAYACTPDADIKAYVPGSDGQATPVSTSHLFRPGDRILLRGRGFDPQAATPVRLRFGGATAPVFAEAPIQDHGGWELTFRLPNGLRTGTYTIFAEAFASVPGGGVDADRATMIDGLPARFQLSIVGEAAPQQPGAGTGTDPSRPRPASRPRENRTPRPRTSAPLPRTETSEPGPPSAPAPARSLPTPPVAEPVTPAIVTAAVPSPAPPGDGPSRTSTRSYAPAPLLERLPLPAAAQPPPAAPLPVAVAAAAEEGLRWYVLALGALGFLLLGAAASGLVVARRRPPLPPDERLEAELQEMIAEQRARQIEPAERR